MQVQHWSDRTSGPLAICVPFGMYKPKMVVDFNRRFFGRAFMFSSENKSHFMCSETFLLMLKEMLSEAFERQRQKHGLATFVSGLLLYDAWTGFHSWRQGRDAVRQEWSSFDVCFVFRLEIMADAGVSVNLQRQILEELDTTHNVRLGDLQCGAWDIQVYNDGWKTTFLLKWPLVKGHLLVFEGSIPYGFTEIYPWQRLFF